MLRTTNLKTLTAQVSLLLLARYWRGFQNDRVLNPSRTVQYFKAVFGANLNANQHLGWWPAAFSPASGGIPLTAAPYLLASLRRCSCRRVTCSAQKRRAPSFCTASLFSSSLRTSYPCRLPGKVFRRRYHQPTHGIVFAFRRSSLDRLSMSTFVTLSWGRLFTGCVYTKKSSYF